MADTQLECTISTITTTVAWATVPLCLFMLRHRCWVDCCAAGDPTTNTLDLEPALGPIVTSTYRVSPDELAFSATIDPDPLQDNGLVIAIPPVTQGCVRTCWRVDLWLPAQDHQQATAILNSVKVTA